MEEVAALLGFAHRGAPHHRRLQNTLPAFRRAIDAGATAIESDVAVTADGVPVLVHPGVITRIRRPVSRLTRAQLPAWVPSLEDVYRECGLHLDIALDMGAPGAADDVVSIAREHGVLSRLWLTYWRLDVVARWRRRYPEVRLVYPVLLLRRRDRAARLIALRDAGVDAVNLFHRSCRPAVVADIHDAGMLAFAWGARNGDAAARALGRGADGVFCDDIDGMVAAVAAEERRRVLLSAG